MSTRFVYDMHKLEGEKGRFVYFEIGLDVFKVQGSADSIFVSERVKKAIQTRKLTGFDFLEIETR
ncbi:hypothetical protein J2S09_000898 [Bacillus fengqiuensis]|nr:hypothetical protein [Bacillus fengqiuensis]